VNNDSELHDCKDQTVYVAQNTDNTPTGGDAGKIKKSR
jgi:hypothetical protein